MKDDKNELRRILNSPRKNDFYLIAETAYHHQGELQYLYRMIDDISDLRLKAIKFHLLLNTQSYMTKTHPLFKELQKWLFTKNEWQKLIDYSYKKKLEVIALCDDVESIEFLLKNKIRVAGIELHASCMNDYFMMKKLLKYKGVIILGIGGTTDEEIDYAVKFFNKNKKQLLLMYGFQSFPTDYKKINLTKLIKIRDKYKLSIGYADHTSYNDPNNEFISSLACALGFNILEKHYTPQPGKKRIDYQSAVSREQIKKIKQLSELALVVRGSVDVEMSKDEKDYGKIGPMKKAIVSKNLIKKGAKLSFNNLWFKRTDKQSPLKQNQFLSLVGLKAKKDIKKDEIIDFSKVG